MTGFLQTNYRFAFSYHSVFRSFLLVIIFAFDMKIQLKIWLLYNGDTLSSSHCLQCCIKTDLISLSCCDQQSSLLAWVLHRCLLVIWHLNFLNLVVTTFTNGQFCNVGNSPQGTLYKLHICKFLNCRIPITTPKTIITQKKKKEQKNSKSTRTNLFTTPEREELWKSCESIIKSGKVTKKRVFSSLKGSRMLEKYSFSQIRTRLVYDRALRIPEDGEKVVSELN